MKGNLRQKLIGQKGVSLTGNAMNPLNWFAGVVQALFVSGVMVSNETWMRIVLFGLIFLLLAFYAFVYCYFMFNDPDRLQSEKYNLSVLEATLLQGDVPEKPTITFKNLPELEYPTKAEKVKTSNDQS